jgi:hypothetical protein
MKKWLMLVLSFLLLYALRAEAATINAASCSSSDVQAAIDSASDGDTVVIPEGTSTWTSPPSQDHTVVMNKGITLRGAGINKTVIIDGTIDGHDDGISNSPFLIRISAVEGKPFRVTGITFLETNDRAMSIYGTCKNWRVDNCSFVAENVKREGIYISGYTYGVIDHCIFERNLEVIFKDVNDAAWTRPLALGTANAVYIEDCTFSGIGGTGALDDFCDGDDGACLVVRYNTITNQYPHVHGNKSGGRSALSMEVYENTLIDDGGTNCYCGMALRGGTGVVFNNEYIGNWGGSPRAFLLWDQNTDDGNCSSYPCEDQCGRGPNQTSEPFYEWNNTQNGIDMNFGNHCGTCGVMFQEGRDYYNDMQRPGYQPYVYPHPLVTGEDPPPPPPPDTTPPGDITSVNDGTGGDVDFTYSTTELSANWTPSTDDESSISKYWYAIGTTAGGTDTAEWTSTANRTVTSVTRSSLLLTVGVTYYFTVRAENGVSLQSNPKSSDGLAVIEGTDDIPPVISNISATNIIRTGATITWNTDEPATSRVEYGLSLSYGDVSAEDSNLVTSHSVGLSGLTAGTQYHYAVVSRDAMGNESTSLDKTFMTLSGIADIKEEIDVKTYPNPYSPSRGNSMRFSVDRTTGGEVRIYTISGRLVKELLIASGENEVNWDVLNEEGNSIKAGLYLYTIIDAEGNKKTGKLAISSN